MNRKLTALALGTLFVTALMTPLSCTAIKHVQLAAATDAAEAHRGAILDDLASGSQPSWAGRYVWSNGRERKQFDISATGFFYEYRHCTGIGELAYGNVDRVDRGRIVLEPRFHRDIREPRTETAGRRVDFHFEREMYAAPWGEETFLIPASLMPEFCALATAGGWNAMEYADYPRLVHSDAHYSLVRKLELSGLPKVPAEFARYLPR
jgi:hypothetical protein